MLFSRRFAPGLAWVTTTAILAFGVTASTTAASSARARGIRGSVKFYLDVRFIEPAGEGTFATSGAFTDSGTFESFPGGAAPQGQVRIFRRYAGRRGSIVMQELFGATETGSWEILTGTGAYARLHGHGTSTGVRLGPSVADVLPPKAAIALATGTVSTGDSARAR